MDGFTWLQQTLHDRLDRREHQGRKRTLDAEFFSNTNTIDLTTNDYLGLAANPEFQDEVLRTIRNLPLGAKGSRLLGADHDVFRAVEAEFARFKGAPASLLFSSGYVANLAVAKLGRESGCAVFSDALNHASIIDGVQLGNRNDQNGQVVVYRHLDYQDLEDKLKASPFPTNLIYTEAIFSMDGDCADLKTLSALAKKYRGVLIVDEAHALGVVGPSGRGLLAASDLFHQEVISINTCGKALGVQGAFVCGPRFFIDALINFARPFIYSTAPSPWMAQALIVSLRFVENAHRQRIYLHEISSELRDFFTAEDFNIGQTSSHIVPVIFGSDEVTIAAATRLQALGIKLKAIRPPTVPPGSSRLRLSLNAGFSSPCVEKIKSAFRRLHP